MLPKLWCWLFGHKLTWKEFSGKYGKQYYPLTGENITVPIVIIRKHETCPRCGAKLEGK